MLGFIPCGLKCPKIRKGTRHWTIFSFEYMHAFEAKSKFLNGKWRQGIKKETTSINLISRIGHRKISSQVTHEQIGSCDNY